MSDERLYTLRWRGREMGPYSLEEINRKLDDHQIGTGHEILVDGEWTTLERFLEAERPPAPVLAAPPGAPLPATAPSTPTPSPSSGVRLPGVAPATARPGSGPTATERVPKLPVEPEPGPAPVQVATDMPGAKPRRRLIYALLGIFFGFAGLHNYYARHWLTGLLQMLLSIATALLGFGVIASWVWAVVEAVLVRRDGNDLEMI
jgi:TM2 domain-containing membrane protein YozV